MISKAERLRKAIAKIEAAEKRRFQEQTRRKKRLRNLQEQLGTITGSIVILVTSCTRYDKDVFWSKGGNRTLTEIERYEEGLIWKKDGESDRLLICEPNSGKVLLVVDVGKTVGFKTQSGPNPSTVHFVVQVYKSHDDPQYKNSRHAGLWPYVNRGPTFVLR